MLPQQTPFQVCRMAELSLHESCATRTPCNVVLVCVALTAVALEFVDEQKYPDFKQAVMVSKTCKVEEA